MGSLRGTREAGKDSLDSLRGTREAGKDQLDSLRGTREAPGFFLHRYGRYVRREAQVTFARRRHQGDSSHRIVDRIPVLEGRRILYNF